MGKESRNRRKKSAGKPSKGLKWLLLAFGLLALIVFVGIFGIKGAVIRYLKSDAFRDQLITAAEKKLHADVELKQLRWEGSTVYIDGWQARGDAEAAFSQMEVDGLRASFNGVENSAWQIPEVRINQASLRFSKKRPAPTSSATAATPAENTPSASAPNWLKKWIPDHAEIGVVRIDATNLAFHDEQDIQHLSLTSVETSSRPLAAAGTWEITGRNGKLFVRNLPPMTIRQLETRWNHNEIFINQAALGFYDTAEISGSGDIQLGPRPKLNLDLQLSNLDTKNLLSPEWKKKLSGSLHGDFTIRGNPKEKNQLISKGSLHLKDGVIEGLPVLELIAQYTKMQRFKRLALHKASADFVKKGERIEISKLVIQSDGLTRLEGSFVLENRQIKKGQFRLGVTPGTLRWIPGAEQKVFTQARDGFLWTPLVISGSIDQPKEDLTARLTGAAIDTLVNDAPGQATDAAKKMLSDPSGTINTGKKLLNSLIPLLK